MPSKTTSSKFEVGKFYMHDNANDVCVNVLGVFEQPEGVLLDVNFWNLGCTGNPWLIRKEVSYLFIPSAVLYTWRLLDEEDMCKPRTEIWKRGEIPDA